MNGSRFLGGLRGTGRPGSGSMFAAGTGRAGGAAQAVLDWRESIAALPDNQFFELMRMYLGEIKTPYNKQNLIESLSAFLRREQNRQVLVSLLDETDCLVLSAIRFIPEVTQKKLTDFFTGSLPFALLCERLLNLEERLILYRFKTAEGTVLIRINPLLLPLLLPHLSISLLLPPAMCTDLAMVPEEGLSPQLIASFLSYIQAHPDVCKADGTFKKHAAGLIEKIFPGKIELLQQLFTAMVNLSLVNDSDGKSVINYGRLVAFSQLSEQFQYVYLAAASCGRFSREGLRSKAQRLLDLLACIPPQGFSVPVLLRAAMLIDGREAAGPGGGESRFNKMLARYSASAQPQETYAVVATAAAGEFDSDAGRLVDAARALGLLITQGTDGDGESVVCTSPLFAAGSEPMYHDEVLTIDAGSTVTMMPGLPLAGLLPLVQFMEIVRYDAASEYEIHKQSVFRGFDNDLSPGRILNLLTDHCLYDIPQTLKINIMEWYRTYSSAMLYSGFVLRTDAQNDVLTQKNPLLAAHIRVVLAPGVYLLDCTSPEQAAELVSGCGFDFVGSIKTASEDGRSAGFPRLRPGRSDSVTYGAAAADAAVSAVSADFVPSFAPEPSAGSVVSDSARERPAGHADDILHKLTAELKTMNLDKEREEVLARRIERRIVLTPAQLQAQSVRLELNEAGGMDFMGKIRIVERAVEGRCLLELLPGGGSAKIIGRPEGIMKKEGDALVVLVTEPEHEKCLFSIGKAVSVKLIRTSIFELRD